MMTQRLWLGLLLLTGGSATLTQARPQRLETRSSRRQLTLREGKTIVNAALEQEQHAGRKPDCSHLAHEVYTRAGYPYPYARSFDLYVGVGSFVRVTKPQPGDLIVWRGHVGIVVDPAEHSFFSSVSSGLRSEFYDAPDWKARGPARFYRYAAAKPENLVLTGKRPQKTAKNAAPTNNASIVEDSHENLPESTHSATQRPDFPSAAATSPASPSTRPTIETRGGPSK
jgi:hypothetical protein